MGIRYFILIVSSLLIGSCFNSYNEKDIEAKAFSIVERLNNDSVNIFKEWNYTRRGEWGYWYKVSADETLYSCVYSVEADTSILKIMKSDKFFIDFPWSYSLDTAKYQHIELSKFEGWVKVKTTFYPLIEIADSLPFENLFIDKNPFEQFSKLNSLKNELGVFIISYRGDIGNFIQFYLTAQHVLTFLPDNLYLNPKSKDIWMKEFEKGKMIKKNWNLRKLEAPLDAG
jgi:hypothetical protein